MTIPGRLVTFDNNVLIDLRKNIDPEATYARQLLDFNRQGKIAIATTISTMLERQRTGDEKSVQEIAAWLQEIGFTNEHIFMGPRTIAFNEQGKTTFGVGLEIALNQCIHHAMFPNIAFRWREYLDQQCMKLSIEGTRKDALIELDNKGLPYFPDSPQAPQRRPTPTLDSLEQDVLVELSDLYLNFHYKWGNAKNDSLGLYNHLTHAVQTAYPDQSIFLTNDNNFHKKIAAIRRCGFRGEILRPAEAVAFIERVAV